MAISLLWIYVHVLAVKIPLLLSHSTSPHQYQCISSGLYLRISSLGRPGLSPWVRIITPSINPWAPTHLLPYKISREDCLSFFIWGPASSMGQKDTQLILLHTWPLVESQVVSTNWEIGMLQFISPPTSQMSSKPKFRIARVVFREKKRPLCSKWGLRPLVTTLAYRNADPQAHLKLSNSNLHFNTHCSPTPQFLVCTWKHEKHWYWELQTKWLRLLWNSLEGWLAPQGWQRRNPLARLNVTPWHWLLYPFSLPVRGWSCPSLVKDSHLCKCYSTGTETTLLGELELAFASACRIWCCPDYTRMCHV